MTRTIRTIAVRMLAMAGFLGMTSLLAPATAHAQTIKPEQAFLNRTAVVTYSGLTVPAGPSRTVDGASALLGRSAAVVLIQPKIAIVSVGEVKPVGGEQALLNQVPLPETGRLMLAL